MDNKISKELFELLNGKNLNEKQHEVIMLLTVSEDGWPHVAMLSVGEIVAINESEVRLAIWPNTNTTNNMIRSGKATLVVVYDGKVHYIRTSIERLPELIESKHHRARFTGKIISIREDMAKYAEIISGIQINLIEPESAIERWEETTVELLK